MTSKESYSFVFLQMLGAIFGSQTTLGAIFAQIFRDFAQIFRDFVCRLEDDRLRKDIYRRLPYSSRPVGRPKLRYKDALKRDLKTLNIDTENWEQLTRPVARI